MSLEIMGDEIFFRYEKEKFKTYDDLMAAVIPGVKKLTDGFNLEFIFKKREKIDDFTTQATFQIIERRRQIK